MKYYSTKFIYREAIIHNFLYLKSLCNRKICTILKADAYGQGIKNVCPILKDECDFFAVQNLMEALDCRKYTKCKVLVLGHTISPLIASKNKLSITVENLQQLKKLKNLNLNVHIEINTGMNRLGLNSENQFEKMLIYIKNNKNLKLEGIYTHFFDTSNQNIVLKQSKDFEKFYRLAKKYFNNFIVHIGGSLMCTKNLPSYVDYIRCGIGVFGYCIKGVKPTMQIESKIIKISSIKKGDYVSYDCDFVADKNMDIAVVPLGYADGISRAIKNNYVLFKGQRLKIVGKICMNMFMIDVSNCNITIKDKVVVFSNAKDWADNSSLSEYEILTGFIKSRTNNIVL